MQQTIMLDLSSFEKAIFQLENCLDCYQLEIIQKNPQLTLHMRAAAIQAFEFTYGFSGPAQKGQLKNTLILI